MTRSALLFFVFIVLMLGMHLGYRRHGGHGGCGVHGSHGSHPDHDHDHASCGHSHGDGYVA